MKKLSMFGLAAIAALALMAVVGASAASAKVCSTAGVGESCGTGHGNIYTGTFDASLSTPSVAKLVSGFITVECGESTIHGTIENGSTGTGTIDGLTFGDCSSGFGACTANTNASTTNKWPGSVAVTTAPNGTITVNNVTGSFTCNVLGSNVTCRYVASTATATLNGGEPATVVATKVALTTEAVSGSSCSGTATWSGTYTVTTPTSLFIT